MINSKPPIPNHLLSHITKKHRDDITIPLGPYSDLREYYVKLLSLVGINSSKGLAYRTMLLVSDTDDDVRILMYYNYVTIIETTSNPHIMLVKVSKFGFAFLKWFENSYKFQNTEYLEMLNPDNDILWINGVI